MAKQNDCEVWQEKRAFEETNMHMLNEGTFCDITFHVGPNKVEIKAHKFILASRSPVFYAMFCGPLSQTGSNVVEITDIEPDIMQTLLRFMYTEDCPINEETVLPLLYAAEKYNIKRLDDKCQIFLSEKISIENVCTVLVQAEKYNASDLMDKCLKFIESNCSKILMSDDFCVLPRDALQQILQLNDLAVNEVEIYNGCKKWAVHQLHMVDKNKNVSHSDIRETLGELLYLIRFPIMSIKDFTTQVSLEEVLSPGEKIYLFQYITAGIKSDNFKFNDKTRMQNVIIRRLSDTQSGWIHNGPSDAIGFVLSKRSTMYGVGLYTPLEKNGKLNGSVCLYGNGGSLLVKKDVDIQHNEFDKTEQILFDNDVCLEPIVRYTLQVTLRGCQSFSGSHGKQEVVVGDLTVSFFNSKSTINKNGTSVKSGQIPFLILSVNPSAV